MGLSNVRFPAMPFIDDVADEVQDVDQPLRILSEVQEELGFLKRPVASNGPTISRPTISKTRSQDSPAYI